MSATWSPLAEHRSEGSTRGRVIVVDDDRATTSILVRDLTAEGFQVEAFNEASGALAALASGTCEALLTDIRMCGMDGMELCRRAL